MARMEWRRIRKALGEYRDWLTMLSGGVPHHQGCPIGGLQTGAACDVAGAPCWCGASNVAANELGRV